MLGGFLLADEKNRNIPTVALLQHRIVIHIDLAEDGAEFAQEWRDGGFRFVAEITARTSIKRNVEPTTSGQPQVFRRVAHG